MHINRFFALMALTGALSLEAAGPVEPLGQSSRLTSVVISEIMYHPRERADGKRLEFIELFNSLSTPEDLSGYRLDGDIRFVFPEGTVIPARGFLVVARNPSDLENVTALTGVLGPFENDAGLPNDAGRVLLRHRTGAVFLEVNYGTHRPWPAAADGAGHSLVLARPSYGENDSRAWAASQMIGGSAGEHEPTAAIDVVKINELLANTDEPELDFIELYNHSNAAVDVSGYVLTDDPLTNKFTLPQNTMIAAGGFVSFKETELNFSLSADGETIYLQNAARTRVIDAVRFGGQEQGVSVGRYPDGGAEFYRLSGTTPGAGNVGMRVAEVIINELMYHPIDEDDDRQFVELHNRSAAPVNVSGWQLQDGITFTIPTNTVMQPGSFLVVARNAEWMRTNYTNLNTGNLLGGFNGRLAYSGERVALAKPNFDVRTNRTSQLETNVFYSAVDEVTYGDGGKWGRWSDGGGSSLERRDAHGDTRRASNWADSDETGKAEWTIVSRTGRLDHGTVAADQLQMFLQGAGEGLVDDVEVIDANGANVIGNSSFASGASGWTAEGTQDGSGWESSEGYNSGESYHVRAVERGDNQLNRIRTGLASSLASGSTATIRAKVRWLMGHPEILFRLRGNWLDLGAALNVPKNLGTPGAANSRAVPNAGPALSNVEYAPILPAAGEAVTVTANVSDADGVAAVSLRFRVDPSTTFTTLNMTDDGNDSDEVAGDGIYTARVSGRSAGTLLAFQVTSVDSVGAASNTGDEFLVRFGETNPAGTFPVYHVWMTQATFETWSTRPKLNNTPLAVTFVLGNHRVIQNAQALYAGSPYISGSYNTPSGNRCGYTMSFPGDEPLLGGTDLVLDWPGGHGNERTAMQEQMGYWIADRMNLPYSHRYWIRLHVNGVTDLQRGTVFEAVIQPAGDFLDAWLPEFEEVDFYKIDRAFEFSNSGGLTADPQPRLENFTTTGGAKKTEKYRWNFLKRSYESANDFSNIFSLVDALNAPSPEPYTSQTAMLVDLEEWMGILAVEHIIVNFDAYGHQIGKNVYAAKPEDGKWQLYMFDLDWLMLAATGFSGNYGPGSAPLFNADDPTIVRMYNHPPFRRAYFRAVKKAVDGPLRAEMCDPVMDAKYAALVANGITTCDGSSLIAPTAVKAWFSQRRAFLVNQLNAVAASFGITSNGGANFNTDSDVVTITGTAPIEVKSIRVSGVDFPVHWTSVTEWSVRVPLKQGINALNIQAVDADGGVMTALSDTVSITSSASTASPAGQVIINEIMANPEVADAEFVELANLSTNRTFDLSGWRLNGADHTIADGTVIAPGAFLVIAKDAGAFTRGYGNTVPLAGEFNGDLDRGGETLSLVSGAGELMDVVTYDAGPPWPRQVPGASLQVIDPAQDNYRLVNWGVQITESGGNNEPQWQFVSTTGTASSSRLYMYMTSAGEVYIDDLKLVAGTAPEAGDNLINNGDFESTFPGPWTVSDNLTGSATSSIVRRTGAGSLRVVSSAAGTTRASSIWQDVSPLEDGATYTLSYWYLPSTNGAGLTLRLSGSGINHTQNISPSEGGLRSTPGGPNSVRQMLPALPPVWINELQPNNASGVADNAGEREPWVELYNSGDAVVSLEGWHLSREFPVNPEWAFPAGTVLGPKQFMIVWLDGEPEESAPGALHTSFRIAPASGTVTLSIPLNSRNRFYDYVMYGATAADRSIGFFPDGQPGPRETLFFSTPGTQNNNAAQPVPILINEWMPANTTALADPADGDFDDWFELYNPNGVAVDLTGYFLSDSLTDVTARWRIPTGTIINARGFLLVWTDGETGQNQVGGGGQLHADFRLSQNGDSIALFAANGTLIDSVTFGAQTNNVSQGRAPDGSENIQFLPSPSPGELNVEEPTAEIVLSVPEITSQGLLVTWSAEPGRRYRVLSIEDLGQPAWTVFQEITPDAPVASIRVPAAGKWRFFKVELIP